MKLVVLGKLLTRFNLVIEALVVSSVTLPEATGGTGTMFQSRNRGTCRFKFRERQKRLGTLQGRVSIS